MAPSSSALLVTGALTAARRRLPRHGPVTILSSPQTQHQQQQQQQSQSPPPTPPPSFSSPAGLDYNEPNTIESLGGERAPIHSSASTAPPLPPRTYKTSSERTPSPPAITPQGQPNHVEAPPLPARGYLPENQKLAEAYLKMPIEELTSAGCLHDCRSLETIGSTVLAPVEEEEGMGPRTAKPINSVLLPKGSKHSQTAPSNLHIFCVEKSCQCKKVLKSIILEKTKNVCECCKQKMKLSRRKSN